MSEIEELRVKIIIVIIFVFTVWFGCKKEDFMNEVREVLRDDLVKVIFILKEEYVRVFNNLEIIVLLVKVY